jgi:putative nucleotidyltransferase with HDIG domain
LDSTRIGDKLLKVYRNVGDLPSLPSIVEKVARLPDSPDTKELERLVSSDQGLTAKVLRFVNSAFPSTRSPTSSLAHAASVLGQRKLRTLALGVPSSGLYKSDYAGVSPVLLWRHSLVVALAAQKIAELVLPARAQEMYVAGLFHDIGISLFLHNIPERYIRVIKSARHDEELLSSEEFSSLGITHAELGFTLAVKCKLSPLICECVRSHHSRKAGEQRSGEEGLALDVLEYVDLWAQQAGYSPLVAKKPRCPRLGSAPQWFSSAGRDLGDILESVRREVITRELDLTGG